MSILQKNKKLAAGIGVAAVAAAALALGAGTYAAFSDTEAGPGGTLAAGTLTLDITGSPTATTQLFSASNIAPGYDSGPLIFTIENTGTIDGTVRGDATVTENAGGELDKQLRVSGNCPGTPSNFSNQPVSILTTGFNAEIDAGDSVVCTFRFTFPHAVNNNDAQGDSVTIDSLFSITQRTT
ncbi:TasA family protein [Pseudonocardia oceani]|uniref:TasA family protein n=1 Tax=Pseudonocardia oceani TaxID=2792013 RepID=UPI001C4A560A|nr:TasA family protein [Pseudonocardia oceani]